MLDLDTNVTRNSTAGAWGRRRRCEHWAVSLFEVVEDVLQRDDGSQTVFLHAKLLEFDLAISSTHSNYPRSLLSPVAALTPSARLCT